VTRLTPITTVTISALLQKAAVVYPIETPIAFKPWKPCRFSMDITRLYGHIQCRLDT
jgi:hypothetical protein